MTLELGFSCNQEKPGKILEYQDWKEIYTAPRVDQSLILQMKERKSDEVKELPGPGS